MISYHYRYLKDKTANNCGVRFKLMPSTSPCLDSKNKDLTPISSHSPYDDIFLCIIEIQCTVT